jgi:hypothetical protein
LIAEAIAHLEEPGEINIILGFCLRRVDGDLIPDGIFRPVGKISVNLDPAQRISKGNTPIVGEQVPAIKKA